MDLKTCRTWLVHQRFSEDLPRDSEIKSMFNWLVGDVDRLTQLCEEQGREAERLKGVNELDRCVVATGLAGMRKALRGREWLRLGRGSYEYDDQRWMDEFSAVFDEIVAAMEPLQVVARNVADCPTTQAGANTATELLTRALKAESALSQAREEVEMWKSRVNRLA